MGCLEKIVSVHVSLSVCVLIGHRIKPSGLPKLLPLNLMVYSCTVKTDISNIMRLRVKVRVTFDVVVNCMICFKNCGTFCNNVW